MSGVRRWGRDGGVTVAVLAAVVTLSSCTGGNDESADGNASPSSGASSPAPSGPSAEEVEESVLDSGPGDPIGSANGTLTGLDDEEYPVVADVYEVVADSDTTFVRFSVRGKNDERFQLGSYALSDDVATMTGFAVVDEGQERRYEPYTGTGESDELSCSRLPITLTSEEFPMTCTVPAIDDATSSVTIAIPDLPAIKDVPVERTGK